MGYVANVTETCDPDNELQLVIKVQVETQYHRRCPDVGRTRSPQLKERTEVNELHTDGGYSSEDVDEAHGQDENRPGADRHQRCQTGPGYPEAGRFQVANLRPGHSPNA